MENKGLIALWQLTDYFSVEIKDRKIKGDVIPVGEHIPITKKKDFDKVFNRHYKKYKEDHTDCLHSFKQKTTGELKHLIEVMKQHLQTKHYINAPEYNNYLYYINTYLPKAGTRNSKYSTASYAICLLLAKRNGKIPENIEINRSKPTINYFEDHKHYSHKNMNKALNMAQYNPKFEDYEAIDYNDGKKLYEEIYNQKPAY